MKLPKFVKMVEVGPRDGLQNEPRNIPTQTKINFINKLTETGLTSIEVSSFVSPKRIPQLSDNSEVLQHITKKAGVHYSVLVPNRLGFNKALAAGAEEIAVFGSASETFSQRNINCSIAESLLRFRDIIDAAKQHNIRVRGYISCVLGCPYEGEISAKQVAMVAEKLFALGCYEISLGDTIGVGTPKKTQIMLDIILKKIPIDSVAVHFHDTYGQALANILASLELGIHIVDSSVSGLGGCPYARGATGNVASEDVLYMLNGLDIETGVDMAKLVHVGKYISDYLGRQSGSKAAIAYLAKGK